MVTSVTLPHAGQLRPRPAPPGPAAPAWRVRARVTGAPVPAGR